MTNDEFRVLPLESTGDGAQQWEDSGSTVTRSVLDNGLRVITQKIPATRSLALSWWVGAGSRDEDQDSAGSTHFLEHLLFKGTARRSAFDIAQAFDAVGGESNAETGKEHTNYWARVLSDDTAMAIDVLGDMISGSLIDPEEFETERGVILDELAMSEDNPPEVVHEAYQLAVFGDNSLGRPVGGSQETIRSVKRDDVWDYYRRVYAPSSLIIAAAGDVNHDEIVEKVCRSLSGAWSEELSRAQSPRPRRSTQMTNSDEYQPERVTRYRHIKQAHVIVVPEMIVVPSCRFCYQFWAVQCPPVSSKKFVRSVVLPIRPMHLIPPIRTRVHGECMRGLRLNELLKLKNSCLESWRNSQFTVLARKNSFACAGNFEVEWLWAWKIRSHECHDWDVPSLTAGISLLMRLSPVLKEFKLRTFAR